MAYGQVSTVINRIMKFKAAFTIIELIVVMLIVIILASILFPLFQNIRQKALKNSCLSNVKNLTQSVILYTTDTEGFLDNLPYSSVSASVEKIYGAIYQKDIWTSIDELKCPCSSSDLPTANGYGKPLILNAGSTINYHIVFSGNEIRNSKGNLVLNTILSPGQNILIIEDFDSSVWETSTRHAAGGSCGRINGSADFLLQYPKNKNNTSISRVSKSSI